MRRRWLIFELFVRIDRWPCRWRLNTRAIWLSFVLNYNFEKKKQTKQTNKYFPLKLVSSGLLERVQPGRLVAPQGVDLLVTCLVICIFLLFFFLDEDAERKFNNIGQTAFSFHSSFESTNSRRSLESVSRSADRVDQPGLVNITNHQLIISC